MFNNIEYFYKYDINGLRISKTNTLDSNGNKYYYQNGLLVTDISATRRLDFLYDENNVLYGFILNRTTKYFYVRDILQNILGIIDESGSLVCRYSYIAFGIPTIEMEVNGIGTLNPIRYKGYYYDVETQLFYCNSRYYSPELCRFIQPVEVASLNTSNINELNLYSYCGNNPNKFSYLSLNSNLDMNDFIISINDLSSNRLRKSHKGVPVFYFENEFINSFSFGFIFMDKSESLDENTYNHEYGHTRQFLLLGPLGYLMTIGIPSVTYNMISKNNNYLKSQYYYMPWEITADIFGNVKRENEDKSDPFLGEYSDELGFVYLAISYLITKTFNPLIINAFSDSFLMYKLINDLLKK